MNVGLIAMHVKASIGMRGTVCLRKRKLTFLNSFFDQRNIPLHAVVIAQIRAISTSVKFYPAIRNHYTAALAFHSTLTVSFSPRLLSMTNYQKSESRKADHTVRRKEDRAVPTKNMMVGTLHK